MTNDQFEKDFNKSLDKMMQKSSIPVKLPSGRYVSAGYNFFMSTLRKKPRKNNLKGAPRGPYVYPASSTPSEPIRYGTKIKDAYPYGLQVYDGKPTSTKKADARAKKELALGLDGNNPTIHNRGVKKGQATAAQKAYLERQREHSRGDDIVPFTVNIDGKKRHFWSMPQYKAGGSIKEWEEHQKVLEAIRQGQIDYDNHTGDQWDRYQHKLRQHYDKVLKYYKRRQAADARKAAKASAIEKREMRRAEKRNRHTNMAGWAPWNPKYGEFKALTADQYKEIGMDYDLAMKPEKKLIYLWNGEKAEVIDSQFGVPLGFSYQTGYATRSGEVYDNDGTSSTEYYQSAFGGGDPDVESWKGDCGHIIGLDYSPAAQLLKVKFKSGSIVVYFRVPSTVAGELLHFARTGQTMMSQKTGEERHVLGIRFWDLIRIRGTLNGARYRYQYDAGPNNDAPFPKNEYVLAQDDDADYSTLKKDISDAKSGASTLDEFLDSLSAGNNVSSRMTKDVDKKFIKDVIFGNNNRAEHYSRVNIKDMLDEYFKGDDGNYNWDLGNAEKADGSKGYALIQFAKNRYEAGDEPAKVLDMLKKAGSSIV